MGMVVGPKPIKQVAVGHGFRPLAHQQALLAAAALPPSAVFRA